jgi:hypothetical protein
MRWGVSGCNGASVSCGEVLREAASMGHPAKTPTRYIGAGDIVLGAKLRY